MKIIYVSDSGDERSKPMSDDLVFGGHTYCLVLNGTIFSYDYVNYFPEKGCTKWLESPEGYRVFLSNDIAIEPKEFNTELDIYDTEFKKSSYFGVEKTATQGRLFGNFCLALESEDLDGFFKSNHYEVLYRRLDEPAIGRVEGLAGSGFEVDGDYILKTNRPTSVLAIDKEVNILWQSIFLNEDLGYTESILYHYKNTAITRLGQLPGTDIKSQIISLDTKTGNTVWKIDLPFYVNHCILIGDRLYLSSALDWNWCVVSADTGDIILQGKVTLPEVHNRIGWLWADSGYLFLDYHSESLHVMDGNTGELIQDVALPDKFSLSSYPEVKDDYIYFRLGTSGEICEFNAYGGVMILSREELRQGPPWTIEVEDKGDISYQAIVDGKTEYYEINASYEELGDVLRFGQIEIKLVAQRYAYNHWGNLDDNWKTRINKKFDGRIVLNIDKAKLRNPDEAKFDLMVELFNKHFEKKFRAPANKKKPLTLSWKYI